MKDVYMLSKKYRFGFTIYFVRTSAGRFCNGLSERGKTAISDPIVLLSCQGCKPKTQEKDRRLSILRKRLTQSGRDETR